MQKNRYDVAVVGLGAFGSAAIYHLARAGLKVLGLEQQASVGHALGSSHGETRIIRLAYFEGPEYVPLLRRSMRLFRELEEQTGQELFYRTGMLDIGGAVFEGSLRSALLHELQHEVLTGAQVNARFPGYRVPENFKAVYQPDGGMLYPEAIIKAHCRLAAAHGARLECGQRVARWRPLDGSSSSGGGGGGSSVGAAWGSSGRSPTGSPGGSGPGSSSSSSIGSSSSSSALPRGVELTSSSGDVFTAGQVIFTAGAWMSDMVAGLKELCVPVRQVVGWFGVTRPQSTFQRHSFPVFVLDDGAHCYYGFPQHGETPGFKIGLYNHLRQVVHPDGVDRRMCLEDEAALRRGVGKYFPGADGPVLKHSACLFTNTPDGHFIIDRHPRIPQVILCSACSGHGFKMSSGVGQLLAHMVANDGSGATDSHDSGCGAATPGSSSSDGGITTASSSSSSNDGVSSVSTPSGGGSSLGGLAASAAVTSTRQLAEWPSRAQAELELSLHRISVSRPGHQAFIDACMR